MEEKKQRRKKKEIDKAIWTAFEKIVIERGFNAVTIAELAKKSGIEYVLLYNRFKNTDDLFKEYSAANNDFWLNNSIRIDPELSFKENSINVYLKLIDNLYENEIMQRILLWELNDTHKTTRHIAISREVENSFILTYFDREVKNTGLNLNILNSMIISGIYFLILHKKISTFSFVNFNFEEAKEQLKETVKYVINKLFTETNDVHVDMAKKLLKKGIDKSIIAEVTELSMKELEKLSAE
jgi:AcrR family transcriptional regulator